MFLIANCSLLALKVPYRISIYSRFGTRSPKMSFLLELISNEKSRKNGVFFASNHKLGSKRFSYIAEWSMYFRDYFTVISEIANFPNLMFTNSSSTISPWGFRALK